MADEEHLKIIGRGLGAWNEWRKKNPEVLQPDLSEADLSWENLVEANLGGTNLSDVNLFYAVLYKADLRGQTSQKQPSGG
jgi:hypothetical protein